jgi:glutaredoxin 3
VLELYATRTCPFCAELREQLDFDGREYAEYDVEHDDGARARFFDLCNGNGIVPLLVEDGRVTEKGWHGRGCTVGR